MMKKLIFTICFALAAVVSIAQSDLELAQHYYSTGEYELAKLYYEKIYKSNRTNQVYTQYLNTLIALGEYEEAEKIVKKKLKSSKNKATAHVDLGDLYKKFGDDKKANAEFDKALDELKPGRANVSRLATMFNKLGEYEYALKTYEKGIKISDDGYGYHYELANLQGAMGNHEEMVEQYLDLLLVSPNYIQTVQNSINRNLNVSENPDKASMLKGKLLKRTQKNPDATIYSEMLIWLFLQEKEFSSAMVQAKALDQRLNENGFRVLDIAQLAYNSKDYYTAKDGYGYIIQKGPTYDYYTVAKSQMLVVRFDEVTQKQGYTKRRG